MFVNRAAKATPVDSSDYSGLWRTGVSDSNKLGPNGTDWNWYFTGVTNPSGSETCQSKQSSYGPSITVYERGDGAYDSFTGGNAGLGSPWDNSSILDGTFPWQFKSTKSRWISQNAYGLHDSSPSCKDPSGPSGDHRVSNSNVFHFELHSGFNIKSDRYIDSKTLKLVMSLQTDNLISVKVNGVPLKQDGRKDHFDNPPCDEFNNFLSSAVGSDFICPNFTDNNLNTLELGNSSAFKIGKNSLTVDILSTYSNIGFIIDDIGLSGEKNPPVIISHKCRPQTVVVSPKSYPAVSPSSYQVGNLSSYNGHIIPVNLYVSGDNGSTTLVESNIRTTKAVDITRYITTGYRYSVYVVETGSHINGYNDHYRNDYSRPNAWATKPSYDEKGKYLGQVTDESRPIGWEQLYDHSTNSYDGPNTFSASPSNVGPCYDYELSYSSIGSSRDYMVEPGANLTFSATIQNYSFTSDKGRSMTRLTDGSLFYLRYPYLNSKSKNTDFYFVKVRSPAGNGWSGIDSIASGKSVQADNGVPPCSYFSGGSTTCETVFNQGVTVPAWGYLTRSINFTVPDDPAGTKYCFASSLFSSTSEPVNDSDSTNGGEYHHSTFKRRVNCFVVSKKPKTQIHGNDLITGRATSDGTSNARNSRINASISVKQNGTYGSWIEYGIFTSGSVVGVASGSAFQSSSINSGVSCSYNTLTFANTARGGTSCSGGLGNYKNSRTIPNVAASFQTSNSTPIFSGVNSSTTSGVYKANGSTSIGNISSLRKGQWIVLNAKGQDVTINGNISYGNTSFTNLNEIPQLVIIARSIKINSNVSNVDAWLVASESIDTCADVFGSLSSGVCSNPLTVNGPVMARALSLRRTAGSGTYSNSGNPAEVFNLRADSYLWAYNRSASSNNVNTDYVMEMPPRL